MARPLSDKELALQDSAIGEVEVSLGLDRTESTAVVQAAVVGRECERDTDAIESWVRNRLIPNTVFIDANGYLEMCIAALRTVPSTVATDFGSSRQRDLGQIWGDKTRGYLGEFALKLYLKKIFDVEIDLAHQEGQLGDFLASDIARVCIDGKWREPDLKVGVKTTKMNGIWLDIPNNQFAHSDVHVAVKLAVPTDHLFSFMKSVGIFRDTILKLGVEKGHIDESESQRINDEIPDLKRIPAYVCGVADARTSYDDLPYQGRKGTKNFTIDGWKGERRPGDLDAIRTKETAAKAEFERIGKFSHDLGFLFNTGSLEWGVTVWYDLIDSL
jgi:hypothetical protein